jgi:hypothetical protein
LLARHNPVIEARLQERHDEGVHEGLARVQEGLARVAHALAEAVLAVLVARCIVAGEAERLRIRGERDLGELERWLARDATCAHAYELWAMTARVDLGRSPSPIRALRPFHTNSPASD